MITNYPVLGRVVILFLDTIVIAISYVLAVHIRNLIGLSSGVIWREYMNLLLIIIIVWGAFTEYQEAYAGRAYRSGRYLNSFQSLRREILIILRTVVLGCPTVYVISVIINQYTLWIVPLSLVVIFGAINFSMLTVIRMILYQLIQFQSKSDKNIKKVVVLGTGDVAKRCIGSIDKKFFKIIGIIGNEESEVGIELYGYKVIACLHEFEKVLHLNYIDELIVALPAKYFGDIEDVIQICDKEGIPVRIVSPFFKNLISKSRVELVYGLPNIIFLPVERNDLEMAIKRMLDIVVSSIGIVLLAPLFMVITILIKIDSSGPLLYRWKILGLHKRPLIGYKFRTMVEHAEAMKDELMQRNEMTGAVFKMSNDPRITKIGKWLRKYSLDELPQLWSVFKGDLSLVGPRPPLETEIEYYKGWHRRKLSVKPGITCLWQISGRNDIRDFDEWMRLDLKYIDEWTLWLDFIILMKTIPAVIKGSGQ